MPPDHRVRPSVPRVLADKLLEFIHEDPWPLLGRKDVPQEWQQHGLMEAQSNGISQHIELRCCTQPLTDGFQSVLQYAAIRPPIGKLNGPINVRQSDMSIELRLARQGQPQRRQPVLVKRSRQLADPCLVHAEDKLESGELALQEDNEVAGILLNTTASSVVVDVASVSGLPR